MILLITPIQRASECAAALQDSVGESVVIAENLLDATTVLRRESCRAVVFDQHLIEAEPNETETTIAHLGNAIWLQINFALTAKNRVVREVQSALKRRQREEATARAAAVQALYADLSPTLTALLLGCEQVLEIPNLPSAVSEKLTSIQRSAYLLRTQIEKDSRNCEVCDPSARGLVTGAHGYV